MTAPPAARLRCRCDQALLAALAVAGCGSRQSTLDPQSTPAREIADLWWWMLAAATFVLLGALTLLLLGWLRRRRPGLPVIGRLGERGYDGLVVTFGMFVPLLALVAVFVVANFSVASDTDAPDPGGAAMTIVVTGNQWFWDVRYPRHERRGDGERDSHPDARAHRHGPAYRRRHPQLLGAAAQPQGGHDLEPPPPTGSCCTPTAPASTAGSARSPAAFSTRTWR
jgi:heme/copper-type cytochrome/quinol oxidase subunit 2